MDNLLKRAKEACVGHPYAKLPWPHRLLHDLSDEIERLREAIRLDIEDAKVVCGGDGKGCVARRHMKCGNCPMEVLFRARAVMEARP